MSAPRTVPSVVYEQRVIKGDGCWGWCGGKNKQGYGWICVNRRMQVLHRYAFAAKYGSIPEGVQVLHHCDNPSCSKTEPDSKYPNGHLFLGTQDDNMKDMAKKGRSQRGAGHHRARLTEAQVREILASTLQGKALAARYGVSKSSISFIRQRINWKHIAI